MDFIIELSMVRGKSVIIVVVDRLSKYCHLGVLTASYTAGEVAEFFLQQVVRLHGVPKLVVSYCNKVFVSKFWRKLMAKSGTMLKMSSTFHPETDSQTEVTNKTIEHYLRSMVHQEPWRWLEMLSWVELWYNSSYHHSLGTTPFHVVYGRAPSKLLDYRTGDSLVEAVDVMLTHRKEMILAIRSHLQVVQNRMKYYADKKLHPFEFDKGDWVWLKLHPYPQHSVEIRRWQKLAIRFNGPFRVERKISVVAY